MTKTTTQAKPATLGECHLCGAHTYPDPRRPDWLTCPTCGPVYMPLEDHYIRVHLACGEDEAARRVARLLVTLERA